MVFWGKIGGKDGYKGRLESATICNLCLIWSGMYKFYQRKVKESMVRQPFWIWWRRRANEKKIVVIHIFVPTHFHGKKGGVCLYDRTCEALWQSIFLVLTSLHFWSTKPFFQTLTLYGFTNVSRLVTPYIVHDLFFLELPVKERKSLERQQKEREEQLLPIYQQVMWGGFYEINRKLW